MNLQMTPTGSIGFIIAPLLATVADGGSLRQTLRAIEDKLVLLNCEMREFDIHLNLQNSHGNRSLPAHYHAWLVVADTTLPTKGVANKNNRHANDGSAPVLAAHEVNMRLVSTIILTLYFHYTSHP
jgi:hypothetical protein